MRWHYLLIAAASPVTAATLVMAALLPTDTSASYRLGSHTSGGVFCIKPHSYCLSQCSFRLLPNRVTVPPPEVINSAHGEKVDERDVVVKKKADFSFSPPTPDMNTLHVPTESLHSISRSSRWRELGVSDNTNELGVKVLK